MQYQLKREVDKERRREERKRELAICQLLAQARHVQSHQEQQRACSFPSSISYAAPYQNAAVIHYVNSPDAASTSNTSGSYEEDNNGYFNL